jgi:hypothetical protein
MERKLKKIVFVQQHERKLVCAQYLSFPLQQLAAFKPGFADLEQFIALKSL